MRLLRALPLALLLLSACGDDDPEPSPPRFAWVPIEGAVCSDGTPTGIGVERGEGLSSDVLVFLMGGGACWDAATCFGLPEVGLPPIATPGPFGEAQFEALLRSDRPGSVLDRSLPANPYRDFTFVFVPYCTGDVHAGDAVQDYPPRGTWHHRGRANLRAAFAHLAGTLAPPGRVVVAGSSAGGFGALLAFDLAKEAWPAAKGYLVDDSGPPLANIPDLTVAAWLFRWDLGEALAAVCGGVAEGLACADDLGLVFPTLAGRYPADRFALLSSMRDEVMRLFFGSFTASPPFVTAMPGDDFEAALRTLAAAIEDDAAADGPGETHAFLVPGATHPMLDRPAQFASGGAALLPWLGQMVDDDPAWAAAIPPSAP